MHWTERLNHQPARIALNGCRGAEVLQWAYAAHLPDNVPHRHTCFEVCLVGEYGVGEFVVEGRPFALVPGTVFIARPGVVHQIVNSQPTLMELFWVAFRWAGHAGADEVSQLIDAFQNTADVVAYADARVRALWETLRLLSGTEAPHLGSDIQIAGVACALLLAIAQGGAGFPTMRDVLGELRDPRVGLARTAIGYIDDNLDRPLPVGEIAAHVGLSSRHLTRLLTDLTGVAPASYVEAARMDRARTLLLRTDEPIKRIAAQVGYADIHHFTRVFTRAVGCPPGRYRQSGGLADQTLRGTNIQKPGALV